MALQVRNPKLWPFSVLSTFLTCFLIPTGCNRPLDTAAVQAIINKNLRVPPRITVFMPYGVAQRSEPGKHCTDPIFEPFGVSDIRGRGLDDAGLVTLTELHPCGDVDIEFTALAQPDVLPTPSPAGDATHYAFLTLATYKGYDVLNIVETPPHAVANLAVHYPLTASGKAYAAAGGQSEEKNCAIVGDELVCASAYKLTRTGRAWQADSPNLLQ